MTILLYSLVLVCLILFPADTADTALRALQIWGINIVPVLFPYMVFSRLLSRSLEARCLPVMPVTAVLGLLGGSPSGAAAVASQSGRLSPRSIYALSCLTGTVSPMFILGSVQSWIRHPSMGRFLLISHWLSAIVCAWIVWIFEKDSFVQVDGAKIGTVLSNPVTQSIDAILQVGGYVILYSVLAGILGKLLLPFSSLMPGLYALLEISGGVYAICQSNLSIQAKGMVISAALGFSGLSILSQNHFMLKPVGIRMHKLILFAVLRAALSALIMLFLLELYSIR